MTRRVLFTAACLLAATPAAAPAQDAPFGSASCPVPAGVPGYPMWVRAEGAEVDSVYLHALAGALARRWEPPSPRRGTFPGLERLRNRLQPPEPRMPDDWAPEARHTARVQATLSARGRPGEPRIVQGSGDRGFDRTLSTAFHDGAPGAPELPPFPAGLDSLRVTVGFGLRPEAGAQTVRFAAQQEGVRVVTLDVRINPVPRRDGPIGMAMSGSEEAVIKYDVGENGRVDPGSIELLHGGRGGLAEAIRNGLAVARFQPAVSNCRPIPLTVVQRFGRR
jgi:hypothetical protein